MRPAKKTTYIGLAMLVFVLVLFASSAIALAAPTFNTPVNSDSGHVANAISLSSKTFSSGVPAAVVTSVDSYADSLAAGVLAKAYSGPLLLTSASTLSADVASELTRLKPAKVLLVGLPSSFVAGVKAAVPSLTDAASIVVLKGADRYETAALVARAVKAKVGTVSKVIVAPGDSYASALAASALAAAQGWPLLLMPAAGPLPQSAKDVIADLGVSSGVVVGTDATLGVSGGFTVTKRIVGATSSGDPDGRYDAAAKLADYAVSQGWLSYSHLGLVPGDDYPDGEATAPFLARDKGVLLVAKSTGLPAATSAAIKDHGAEIKKIDFVGLGWPVFREVKSLNSARVTGLNSSGGPVGGGNKLVVTGTALTGAARVRVGKVDVSSSNWNADSATQLTIASVPAASGDGPVEVTVFNFWGPSPANTKDLYWYGGDGVLSPGEKVVQKAVEYLGVPYLWAGASPTSGFDCSGFCMYVYKQFGVSLPHYSRTMATYGTAVNKEDLQPGDLIFFYTPISHVGMYVGGGMMINAPRSGDLVTIEDAYRSSYVTARRMLTSPSPYTRYEQGDSHLAYAGTWSTSSTTSASGGNFLFANASGTSVTISFSGTYLGWIAKKSPVYGIAKVTLDQKTPVMLDLYSSSTVYQQKVWSTGTLAAGNHTVKIEWTGTKNAAATDTNIGLDALDLIGTLTAASTTPPAPPNPAPTTTRYEQKDTHFTFAGGWIASSSDSASAGSFRYADSAGSSATATFNGTFLAWIGKTAPVYGKAKVTLDGRAAQTVDLYSADTKWQQKIWDTGTLPAGAHTVKIEWTGAKSASAIGANINVDAFDIAGKPGQAPAVPATRVEQNDVHFVYTGAWTVSSSPSASAGSFRFADSTGSSLTVTFVGSYLSWVAKKSPVYGKARVTLDGGTPAVVDLYSARELWKQKVWETNTIVPGTHMVKIEWTGTKSSAATGTNVGVDAFDLIGVLK